MSNQSIAGIMVRMMIEQAERERDASLFGANKLYKADGDLEAWNVTEEDRGDGFETSHETNAHEDRLR